MVETMMEEIPQVCREALGRVRDRISMIVSRYGSLATYGKPPFEDVLEVACIVYINETFNVSLEKLAKFLGYADKTALYKMVKKIEESGKFTIYQDNQFKTITMSKQELISLVESQIKARAREHIEDVFSSAIIKRFWESPIKKRAVIAGKPSYLSEYAKKRVIKIVERIMKWMAEHNYPTNPDFWKEDMVEKAIYEIFKTPRQVYHAKVMLRSIPEWSRWFEGSIGAVTKVINPVTRVLLYEDYLKLKSLWKEGKIADGDFLTIWLHLTTGAREGVNIDGKDITRWEDANTSLFGIKWSDIYYDNVDQIHKVRVYEHKTNKTWEIRLDVIDPDPINKLLSWKQRYKHVIRDLLGCDASVIACYEHYKGVLKHVSQLLGLQFTLKPHDIRRSHLSILAELGVDLVSACSGDFNLGVGWEDIKTAYIFYLRFSRRLKEKVWSELKSNRGVKKL